MNSLRWIFPFHYILLHFSIKKCVLFPHYIIWTISTNSKCYISCTKYVIFYCIFPWLSWPTTLTGRPSFLYADGDNNVKLKQDFRWCWSESFSTIALAGLLDFPQNLLNYFKEIPELLICNIPKFSTLEKLLGPRWSNSFLKYYTEQECLIYN